MIGRLFAAWALVSSIAASPPAEPRSDYFPPEFSAPSLKCPSGATTDLWPILGKFESKWFSRDLAAAREPSLYRLSTKTKRPAGSTVRFTWLPSFDARVVVRIEGLGTNTPRLIAKRLSAVGGADPGTIAEQIDRPLSPLETATVETSLRQTAVLTAAATTCDSGADGSDWIIEGVDGTGYHFVHRYTPRKGEVRDFGEMMLRLSGWPFRRIY